MAGTGAIDWAAAVRSGQRRVPRGPVVTAEEAHSSVRQLRELAAKAETAVRETTGLGLDLPIAPAHVVDRRGWVAAAAEGMAALTQPLTDALIPADYRGPSAGSQLGLLLAFLSSRVLGQFDPVGAPGSTGGRLLLVAPNIVMVEREIGAVPAEFRLWVCLHESTHRLQFTAVDWMTDYFRGLVAEYAAVAPGDAREFLRHAASALVGRERSTHERDAADTWLRRIQTPEQQAVFDRLMALMTLLEGHADFVMDAVGPAVVPTVSDIRRAFTARRAQRRSPVERLVRALIGMDAKIAQYARGSAFVRAVADQVGIAGFNAVFTSPRTLPSLAEIDDPAAWVRRVHG